MITLISILLFAFLPSVEASSLVLSRLYSMKIDEVHIDGLESGSNLLTMFSVEGSETYGSLLRIEIDPQSGETIIEHYGQAFVSIFRPDGHKTEIIYQPQDTSYYEHPPQATFDKLFSSESDETTATVIAKENDVLIALIPSTAEWPGLKPVDLQNEIGDMNPSDLFHYLFFINKLPDILPEYDVSIVVARLNWRPNLPSPLSSSSS